MNNVTKFLVLLTLFGLLISVNTEAQDTSHVYNDTTSSGMFFQGNGAEVTNPVSDEVNSSSDVAMSDTGGTWQQIQYFPTYTPESGDKLFFSVHNPNGAGPGQVQFEYASDPGTWQYGADVTYETGSETGWVEYSVDLDAHAGNEINKIIIMPAGDNSSAVYIDNMYFSDSSEIATPAEPVEKPLYVYNDTISSGMFFQGNGAEVTNPVSDEVNSSSDVAMSGTGGTWQQIQYFPTYTPESGDKLFFSVHNPNGVGPGQVQFEYASDPGTWQFGANVTYEAGSETGWVEYSLDLDAHAGNEINKIIIMLAGDNSSAVYIDNMYFSDSSEIAVSIKNDGDIVKSFELNQNYPNPFNPSTNIGFSLPSTTSVTLKVYNLLGQEVATLIDGAKMNIGTHSVLFDAGSLSSGVYFFRIEAGNFNSTKQMMLIK